MSNTKTRIIAAVVDQRELTLYKEDGSTIVIPQGDPSLRHVLAQAVPQIQAQGWAEVELMKPEDKSNPYHEFEQKTSGLVRFFRVAKAKLKELLIGDEGLVASQTVGEVPSGNLATNQAYQDLVSDAAEAIEQFGEDELERYRDEQEAKKTTPASTATMNVVDEIIKHAIPSSTPGFDNTVAKQGAIVDEHGNTNNQRYDNDEQHTDTIVAVVDNKVVAGVEKIKTQFGHALKGSTKGMENFLKRVASVKRSHSVEDLLKFLERGDLPIADDGSILIYKVLKLKGDEKSPNGGCTYVDCHSGNVTQFIGAFVCMSEDLVDHNRRNECSNGLHVARRGYVKSFSGDVCVLAKLAPEDVIAVPQYDANKMRVCGYHILAELSAKQYGHLNRNEPITHDPDGAKLLAKAMAGDHIRRTHEVRIHAAQGGGLRIRPLDASEVPEVGVSEDAPTTVTALVNPEDKIVEAPVSAKEVIQQVEQVSKKQQAKDLYDAWAAAIGFEDRQTAYDKLLAFKKAAKKGWDVLGIPMPLAAEPSTVTVDKVDHKKEPNRKSVFATKPKPPVASPFGTKPKAKAAKVASPTTTKEKKMETNTESPGKKTLKEIAAMQHDLKFTSVDQILNAKITPTYKIKELRALGLEVPGVAAAILKVKKEAKKSWEYFGMNGDDYAKLLELSLKN